MQPRKKEDRRENDIKVKDNLRKNFRREEDQANITSYYILLLTSITILLFIGVISYIWGR